MSERAPSHFSRPLTMQPYNEVFILKCSSSYRIVFRRPPTLCLASSISQACRSMLIGWLPCSCSAVRDSHVCTSSSVFWNWPRPSRAHSSWCWWEEQMLNIYFLFLQHFSVVSVVEATANNKNKKIDNIVHIVDHSGILLSILRNDIRRSSPVCQQSLIPSCPSAVWSHTAVRRSLDAPSPETAGTRSDGSGSLSLFSSGKVLA